MPIYEKQLAEQPDSNDLQLVVAQINHDIGRNHSNSKRYADSFPYFENAMNSLEKFRRQNPDKPEIMKLLGDCHIQFSLALSWEERQTEAENHSAKAIEIFGSVKLRPTPEILSKPFHFWKKPLKFYWV